MGEVFSHYRKENDTTVFILRHSTGKYTVRYTDRNDNEHDNEYDTGVDMLARYINLNSDQPGIHNEYDAAMDNFMHTHFTEEQWALAVLSQL